MEKIEKEFTPEESLQLISQIISRTRRNLKASSFYFILWGWVIVFASLACFFTIKYMVSIQQFKYINLGAWMAWIIPVLIGAIIGRVHSYKMEKQENVKSQIGNIMKVLWSANGVTIIIGCLIAYKSKFYPAPIILAIVGMSTFLTGYIIKFKALLFGGIIFWLSALISLYIPGDYQLLLTAFSIILGYLIPGYMIKYSKE